MIKLDGKLKNKYVIEALMLCYDSAIDSSQKTPMTRETT